MLRAGAEPALKRFRRGIEGLGDLRRKAEAHLEDRVIGRARSSFGESVARQWRAAYRAFRPKLEVGPAGPEPPVPVAARPTGPKRGGEVAIWDEDDCCASRVPAADTVNMLISAGLRTEWSWAEAHRVHWGLHGGPQEEELVNSFEKGTLTRHSLLSLVPRQWLNDEVINVTLTNAQAKADERSARSEGCAAWLLGTFFLPSVSDGGYNYAKVRRLSRRKKRDVTALDLIVMPLHIGQVHWAACVAYPRRKRLYYLDSMGRGPGRGTRYMKLLAKYLEDDAMDKSGVRWDCSDGGADAWVWRSPPCPQQDNTCDCGVFMLSFARRACEALPESVVPAPNPCAAACGAREEKDAWGLTQSEMNRKRFEIMLDLIATMDGGGRRADPPSLRGLREEEEGEEEEEDSDGDAIEEVDPPGKASSFVGSDRNEKEASGDGSDSDSDVVLLVESGGEEDAPMVAEGDSGEDERPFGLFGRGGEDTAEESDGGGASESAEDPSEESDAEENDGDDEGGGEYDGDDGAAPRAPARMIAAYALEGAESTRSNDYVSDDDESEEEAGARRPLTASSTEGEDAVGVEVSDDSEGEV